MYGTKVISVLHQRQKQWPAVYQQNPEEKCGGNRASVLSEEMQIQIKNWVDEDCTIFLKSISQKISEIYGISVCKNAINKALHTFHKPLKVH